MLATTLDGQDAVGFSDLGSILGEADLGSGNDAANPVDQTQPFRLVLRGGPGRDDLLGGRLNDTIDGGDDTDRIDGAGGPDDLRGGAGFDELRYDLAFPARAAGVHVTIDDLADDGEPGEQDNAHTDIEDLTGTDQNDVLIGSDASNVIVGLGGDDQITGGGNFDVLFGDLDFLGPSGNDTIFARDSIGERINCGAGTDKVVSDDIDGVSECETNDTSPDAVLDRDQDGVNKPGDCNDANPAIKPGLFDTPEDGIDQNCDGADAVILDRDRDGFNRPQDCDDNRATVFPGADEIRANRRDEDCDGLDATPTANVVFATDDRGRSTLFDTLTVRSLARGDKVRVSCRRCGVPTRTLTARKAGSLQLARHVRRPLRAGRVLELRVSRPLAIAVVFRLRMRVGKAPLTTKLCLPPGAKRPRRC